MKPNEINTPADLINGDYVIFVTWQIYKATPAKIEKVAVDDIMPAKFLNSQPYINNNDNLGREYQPKKWVFRGRGVWDLRKCKFGDSFYYLRGKRQVLFNLSQSKEAELFAKVEVPKLQLSSVVERIDSIRQNFTNKLTEMEELERILQKNIDYCGETKRSCNAT